VIIRAANGFTSAEQSYAIAVTENANTIPLFTSSPPTNGAVGIVYAYTPTVLDPDQGQSLTYSLFTAPMGMSVDSATGALDWTPAADQTGHNPVSLNVDDGFSTTSQVVNIYVAGPSGNVAPMFTSSPLLVAVPDREYSYTAVAIDPDGQPLTYSLFTAPDGMTIDSASGLLVWTPTEDDAGANAVSVGVTDGVSTSTQIFSVNVEVEGDGGGCGCSTTGDTGGAGWMIWAMLALTARRKRWI
jgi:MYXO-CTERM domain-containing protein